MNKITPQSGGFPVTTKTIDFLQDTSEAAIRALTALGGDTFILEGIQVVNETVTKGSIVYNGEVLPFKAGPLSSTVNIYESVEQVPYNEDANRDGKLDLKPGYLSRYAQCGTADGSPEEQDTSIVETFAFNLLKRFTPLTKLSIPVGLISMWSGTLDKIPQGWTLCDGNNNTPNLKDRFIVGAGNAYTAGSQGGLDSVTLTENQMPSHYHNGSTSSSGNHKHTGSTYHGGDHNHSYRDGYYIESFTASQDKFSEYGSEHVGSYFTGSGKTDTDNSYIWYKNRTTNYTGSHYHSLDMNYAGSHYHNFTTSSKGSSQGHENRPPYYALAFIMFVGL